MVRVWASLTRLRFGLRVWLCFVFFFQAEDGIRDHCVTGVQTCALPISAFVLTSKNTFSGGEEFTNNLKVLKRATIVGETTEIGRASCRESVDHRERRTTRKNN